VVDVGADLRRELQLRCGGRMDDDKTALPICPPAQLRHPEQPLTRAEAWTPCACSLQHRELMAQDNKFQQKVKALAAPRPHCRKPSKDPSRHEL
jgi:hypothetical protein